ncbi:MAG TPA: SUMF1/EgtB/PvdO family nonheme iron enzyme [Aestuariivirgaceae bacterium]|jgi:formylglycine-generating enzyme required for sulfatase activity
MMGQSPKRKALDLRNNEYSTPREDLDDIFVPDSPAPEHSTAPEAKSEAGLSSAKGPTAVRTRLILRRALLRQARAARQARQTSSSTELASPKELPSPSRTVAWLQRPRVKPTGFQLSLSAAVSGVLFGAVLAYFLNEYFKGNVDPNLLAPTESTALETAAGSAVPQPDAVEESEPSSQDQAEDAAAKIELPEVAEPAETTAASATSETGNASAPVSTPPVVEPPPDLSEDASTHTLPLAETSTVALPAQTAPETGPAETMQQPMVAAIDPKASTSPARNVVLPENVETFQDCDLCPTMVKIHPGEFTMGSPASEEGHQSNEGPQRLVKLSKQFAIGQFEVTVREWDACVADGGCKAQVKDEGWGRENRPAINISWEEIADQYLPWLSKKTGHKYRLPTESEWEFAARGNADGEAKFGFGDNLGDLCAYANGSDATAKGQASSATDCKDGYANTAPTGSFKPNQLGLFDMHGNVWEWVEDCWNETYENAPVNGSAWTTGDCTTRVVRGGSWNSDIPKLRSAARGWNQPSGRNRSIGFRVVREL